MNLEAYLFGLVIDKYNGFFDRIAKAVLFVCSLIYGVIIRGLILFYRVDPYRLRCKVISVGNITLGGTGKTVLVEYIARFLREKGKKVAILTRGYKRKGYSCCQSNVSSKVMGDEPYMLKVNLQDIPVIVDSDRVRAAKKAIREYGVDTVILDDGMQQWRIKKDLELIAVDVTSLFGNRHMIPRGILREPVSGLRRADVFALTNTAADDNPGSRLAEAAILSLPVVNSPGALIIKTIHDPVGFYSIEDKNRLFGIDLIKGKTLTLVSGIGNPDSFEQSIKDLGAKVGLSYRFPDHYYYTRSDLEKIVEGSKKNNIATIVTTEKDASKLRELNVSDYKLDFLVLRICLKVIDNEQAFFNRLLRLYTV